MRGNDTEVKELRGVAPTDLPKGAEPLVPSGKHVPLGLVRLTKPNKSFPEFRLRFTPAKGQFYLTEICSGKALNDLLDDLRSHSTGRDSTNPSARLPLDDAGLKQINVTTGAGNIGLLKSGGRFSWPFALNGTAFLEQRDRLSVRIEEAVRQATVAGRVDAVTLRELVSEVDKLGRMFAKELAPLQYIEASFLRHLDELRDVWRWRVSGRVLGTDKSRVIPG
jgi:hypothetical protein